MANKRRKKGKHLKASFYWLFLLVFAALFVFFFMTAGMFPMKWKLIGAGITAVIVLVMGLISFHENHVVMKVLNVILAVLMAVCSVALPYFETRVTNMIDNNNDVTNNTIKMNIYAMSDSYKEAHPDVFADSVMESQEDGKEELKSYADSSFITQLTVDADYQKEAVSEIEKIVGKNINLDDKSSVQEAAQALYDNEAPLMVMNAAYASMLDDMEGFENFDTDTRIVYTVEVPEKSSDIALSNTDLTTKPFAVFIGGNDEEGKLTLTGRTDVDMVLVVNPVTYQIGIFSYPRDSYVPNPALNNRLDKLTHLGVSGLDNTMNGLENLLGVDVDNYVLLNFTTYMEIINALGGVDVDNPYAFKWSYDDHHEFPAGNIHLDGIYALEYVRERHNLPDGDFGRNMHQQIVMKAILQKVTSPSVLIHFDSLITALNGTFLTNLTSNAIYSFMQYQLDNNISWNIVNYRAEGTTDYAICASAPAQELSVVLPYENQLEYMTKTAQAIMNGETVTQEDMPEGSGIRWQAVHSSSSSQSRETENYSRQNNENTSQNTYTPEPTYEPAPEATVEPQPTTVPEETPVPENNQTDNGTSEETVQQAEVTY